MREEKEQRKSIQPWKPGWMPAILKMAMTNSGPGQYIPCSLEDQLLTLPLASKKTVRKWVLPPNKA